MLRRPRSARSLLLVLPATLALFLAAVASPAAAVTSPLALSGRQSSPSGLAGGFVFSSDPSGADDFDLYQTTWSGTPSLVIGGPGHQWQPSVSGGLLAYVDQPTLGLSGTPTASVRVRDLASGAELVVSTPGTLGTTPSLWGMMLVWIDVRASGARGAVMYRDLDADRDGVADFLEAGPTVQAATVEAVSGLSASRPDMGPAGLVWADRTDGAYRVLRRSDPLAAETQEVLTPAQLSSNPEPVTAEGLIVWSEGSRIVVLDVGSGVRGYLGLASENNTRAATDGTNVAWCVGSAASTWRLQLKTTSGTRTVAHGDYGLTDPAFGEGRILWTRILDLEGVDSSIEWTSVDSSVPCQTHVTLSAPAVIPYNVSTTITGALTGDGSVPVPGQTVRVQVSSNGTTWSDFEGNTAETGANGEYSVTSPLLTSRRYFRAVFAGTTGYVASSSPARAILPKAWLSYVYAPSSMYRNRAYTVYGYLRPRHTAGTYAAEIQAYRYESGRWVLRKTVWAKASNYSYYSKLTATLSLPYAGRWLIRFRHRSDSLNALTYSSAWKYVTVR